MRISAGKYKGKKLQITNLETTRETTDKVRQAIFNSAQQFFDGGVGLDLFAGSGEMGLEGLSRGLDEMYFNDVNKKAISIIKKNVSLINTPLNVHYSTSDYKAFLSSKKDIKFDFIFLDPPYEMLIVDEIISFIDKHDMLTENGIIVFEMSSETLYNKEYTNLYFKKEKKYGIKKIAVFKRV